MTNSNFLKNVKSSIRVLWKYSKKTKVLLLSVLLISLLSTAVQVFALFVLGQGTQDILLELAFFGNDKLMPFVYTMIAIGLCYLIQLVCSWLQAYFLIVIAQRLGYYIRYDLAKKVQRLTLKYLDTHNTGDLMSRFTNDVDAVVLVTSQAMSQVLNAILVTIGVTISMYLINPVLASIALVLIIILFSFIIIFIKRSQPLFLKQQRIIGTINGDAEEYISAHKMTSLFRYENEIKKIFSEKNQNLKKVSFSAQFISGMIFPYNNFINNFSVSVITCIQVLLLIFAPSIIKITAISTLTLPAVIAMMFITFLRQATSQISTVFTSFNQFQLAFAALSRIEEILDHPNEKQNAKPIVINKPIVEFKNVYFGYDESKMILKNISFVAKPKTMNAIVGPTGSGKTTIISLLTRFYDINSGQILIDGKDISKYSRKSVRKEIGIVLQDSFMFSNTILENIRIARPSATDAEVIAAAKHANAHKFISKLPNGYHTEISNTDDSISEGEKQLISIARAFLSTAKIIILDEATSYVDTKTEKDIQKAMNKLMKSRTSFVIAHRLSTIKDADNIVVIKDGEILESGNHNDLMSNKHGFYYSMNKAMNNDLDSEK